MKIRSRSSGFQWDIYRVKVSSGRQIKVTDDTFIDDHPTWSPDGRRIAFTSERGGARDIYSIKPDGTGLKNISSSPEAEMTPDWSPDGSKLVFGRYLEAAVGTEGWQIFVARKDGSRSRQLTENATASNFSPAWAPGGQRIVFTREDDLFVMNKKGNRERRLTGSADTSNFFETTPDW